MDRAPLAGDYDAGDRGLAGMANREAEHRRSIETALVYAQALRCKNVHVLAGTQDGAGGRELLVEQMRWACDRALPAGVNLLIEPLNGRDFPGYLIPDSATALEVIQRIDRPNVGLQLDLYHLQITEGDVLSRMAELLSLQSLRIYP